MSLRNIVISIIAYASFSLPMFASGQVAVADVDSTALSTSDTTVVYTAATMWRECVVIARGGDVLLKIAHSVADTSDWASNPYMTLLQNESISIMADYNNNNTGLRAYRAKMSSGTGALIIAGTKKE